jgi:ADP-heptose:LPS heptosyltransferase
MGVVAIGRKQKPNAQSLVRFMEASKPVLVIHPGALGDVVASFFALRLLAAQVGPVHLVCQQQIGEMACRIGAVEQSFPIESARFSALYGAASPWLKEWIAAYETVLLLTVSPEPAASLKRWFTGSVIRIPPRPAANRRVHTAAHLIARFARSGLADPAAPHFRDLREENADPNRVILHPGAGSPKKRWPVQRFLAVSRRLAEAGRVPEFFLGPAETDLEDSIRHRNWPVFVATDLPALAAYLRCAGGFVGNDSGVSHLAAYIGLPTVAVFGPTDPVRWAPIGRASAAVAPRGLECHPCFETPQAECRGLECLAAVSDEQVFDTLLGLLGEAGPPTPNRRGAGAQEKP